MPLYLFRCSEGHAFERRAGYEQPLVACDCGAVAQRAPFYRDSGVIFAGGGFTKSTLPPASDHAAVQDEWFKEVRKAGWTGERAVEEIRRNRVYDKEGRMFLDTSKLPKES